MDQKCYMPAFLLNSQNDAFICGQITGSIISKLLISILFLYILWIVFYDSHKLIKIIFTIIIIFLIYMYLPNIFAHIESLRWFYSQ